MGLDTHRQRRKRLRTAPRTRRIWCSVALESRAGKPRGPAEEPKMDELEATLHLRNRDAAGRGGAVSRVSLAGQLPLGCVSPGSSLDNWALADHCTGDVCSRAGDTSKDASPGDGVTE